LEIYLATAFGSTFAFLSTHKANKKCKRATKQTHQNTTTMDGQQHDRNRATSANSSLAKWRVTCFYDSLVLNQSAVLRLNFCAKMPPLRQAAKRWQQ